MKRSAAFEPNSEEEEKEEEAEGEKENASIDESRRRLENICLLEKQTKNKIR